MPPTLRRCMPVGAFVAAALVLTAMPTGRAQDPADVATEPDPASAELVEKLVDDSPAVVFSAGQDLQAMGGGAASHSPRLVELLTHESPSTRRVAYECLARLGRPAAAAALDSLARGPDSPDVRAWTEGVVWEIGAGAMPEVLAGLESDDDRVRRESIGALGILARDVPAAATALDELVADSSLVGGDLVAALNAVERSSRHSKPCIVRASKETANDDAAVRSAALRALRTAVLRGSCEAPVTKRPGSKLGKAVKSAHTWLLEHRQPGAKAHWVGGGFTSRCPVDDICQGTGDPSHDIGISALAVCALIPGCRKPRVNDRDPVADAVRETLMTHMAEQQPSGKLTHSLGHTWVYNHMVVTVALASAYGRSGNPLYRASLERAVEYVVKSQNPGLGWRYLERSGDNDTSVTAWAVHALGLASLHGIDVPQSAFDGAAEWFDKLTEDETGRVGYQRKGGPPARTREAYELFPADKSEALTAIALHARLLAGNLDRSDDPLTRGTELCASKPPAWSVGDGSIDMYYWLAGTHLMRLVGGDRWESWSAAVAAASLEGQVTGRGHDKGSWPIVDPWSGVGGRVYTTAAMLWSLELVSGRACEVIPKKRVPRYVSSAQTKLLELDRDDLSDVDRETLAAARRDAVLLAVAGR